MRVLFGLLFSIAILSGPPSTASPLPGTDDPALRDAALEWLHNPRSTDALWAIGESAVNGNVAARELASTISRSHVPVDFPSLDSSERRALFPSDGAARRFGSLYPFPAEDHPALMARRNISSSETPQDWIAQAEILRDAGMHQELFLNARIAASANGNAYGIEAVRYLDPILTANDALQADIWMFRALESMLQPYREQWAPEKYARDLPRWGGTPWTDEVAGEFTAALDAGRWTAIRSLGFLLLISEQTEVPFPIPDRPELVRFANLANAARNRWFHGPLNASPDNLDALGALLIADAGQSAYLQPLLNVCTKACDGAVPACMAVGVLNEFARHGIRAARVEPVISFEEYAASDRAAQETLSVIAHLASPRAFQPLALPLPACLAEAVQE